MILILRIHFHHIAASANVRPYEPTGLRWSGFDFSVFGQNLTDPHPVVLRTRDTTSSDLYVSHSIRPPMLGAMVATEVARVAI